MLSFVLVDGLHFDLFFSNAELVSQVAKLRLDLATLDRQLLDAVSQKLLLSQQLEAWQVSRH